ncbi:hypothetical protein ACFLT7_04935 [candidate division KSB1 bacterium]
MRLSAAASIVCVLIAAQACLRNDCGPEASKDGDTVTGTGTVIYLDFEGGFYGIVSDDGEHHDPINMESEFKRDGLRVRFSGIIRDDLMSYHMWGHLLELTYIEVIE